MRQIKILQGCAIALAALGIVLPRPGTVLGADIVNERVASQSIRVADVALGQGGILTGQVVNTQGAAQPGVAVTVSRGGREVASLKTDQAGYFTATGLNAGAYVVSTEGAIGPVRAWARDTAPPTAGSGLLLVRQTEAARGQIGPPNLTSLVTNPGVILTAAFAGTVIAVAVDEPKQPSS